jgi:hypothetical protein
MLRPAFRNGFYAGALVAVIAGVYLFQLWQPDRQVHLHSLHLADALEEKDWAGRHAVPRAGLLRSMGAQSRGRRVALAAGAALRQNLRVDAQQTITSATDGEGRWIARIRIEADDNEVAAFIKARVNVLEEPFELHWRRQSWKPWDWQLVRVNNSALELPTGSGF